MGTGIPIMAEIDTNPVTPVWPRQPVRKINPDEKGGEQRPPHQHRRDDNEKKKEDDDPSSHIDEYV